MTSHPRDLGNELIATIAALPYVAKEFHLPLQSGDDEILKKMNRGYTVEFYKDRVKKIRELMPNARLTTDIMVGFPGESEAQFNNSLKMIEEMQFAAVNMFAYSSRTETAAAKLLDQIPEEIKQARLQRMIGAVRDLINSY